VGGKEKRDLRWLRGGNLARDSRIKEDAVGCGKEGGIARRGGISEGGGKRFLILSNTFKKKKRPQRTRDRGGKDDVETQR